MGRKAREGLYVYVTYYAMSRGLVFLPDSAEQRIGILVASGVCNVLPATSRVQMINFKKCSHFRSLRGDRPKNVKDNGANRKKRYQ